jgi:eukaryotic-like serine/threonine-protein kinase
LEPMLRRALAGAGFVSAYDRGVVVRTGVAAPDNLNEAAAYDIAVKQGLGVVLAGVIEPRRSGYRISVKATETVTGATVTTVEGSASSKDEVLDVATRLMASVRTALGDETSESAQIFAMASLSATSLDVVRHYAAAQEAASNNRFEEARQRLSKAVELDPTFGVGYQLLAVVARNLGQLQDAERYINEALRYLNGMTERERFSTRGFYFRVTGDYQQCVKEYGEMIARFAADVTGRNQLALCLTQLRNMRQAVEEMQQVVDILPRRVLFRANLAWYASYAGDFARGEREARAIEQPDVYGALALAFAQVGQRQFTQAAETYRTMAAISQRGASFAASGLGDLAIAEGRFADAVRILDEGIVKDLAANDVEHAAAKLMAVAHAELARGRAAAAIAAVERALAISKAVKIRFLAGRSLVEAGQIDRGRTLIAELASDPHAEPRAYARILEGEIALQAGNARQAVTALLDANTLLDTWIGHFALGRAYLAAGELISADSEFDRCIKRVGESLSLFLDEEPTFGYFPTVYYYQGRIREELKTEGFTAAYQSYLGLRGQSNEDVLVKEARERVSR